MPKRKSRLVPRRAVVSSIKDRQRNNCRIFFPLTLPSPTEGEGTSDSYFFADPKPIVQRMIAIDALLASDGLIIDLAAAELGVVGRSVRRSLDILRELAGPTVFEIDEATGRHRHC